MLRSFIYRCSYTFYMTIVKAQSSLYLWFQYERKVLILITRVVLRPNNIYLYNKPYLIIGPSTSTIYQHECLVVRILEILYFIILRAFPL
jgi:hypothetical protein